MWLIALNERDAWSFQRLHQLLAQSLLRLRSRRACVRANVHVVRVCVYLCIYECVRTCVYVVYVCVYVNVYVCMYIHVYMYVLFLCICIRMHMCGCTYIYVHFFAVSVACTVEQVFWAPVHVQLYALYRWSFDINVHNFDTFAAGSAHMYLGTDKSNDFDHFAK